MTHNTRSRVNPGDIFRIVGVCVISLVAAIQPNPASASDREFVVASGQEQKAAAASNDQSEPTPEEKFARRYPQPVRVGDLLGLAVLDENDSTIGYVRQVVRSLEGKIFLIVPYSAWFGWADTEWGKHPVAVPIERVTILARQIDAEDMSRDDFDSAPTWAPGKDQPLAASEKTLIALGRR